MDIVTLSVDPSPFFRNIISQTLFKIKAIALYIINFAEIEYHQNEVLHIIIAKVIQPTVDDIRLWR